MKMFDLPYLLLINIENISEKANAFWKSQLPEKKKPFKIYQWSCLLDLFI